MGGARRAGTTAVVLACAAAALAGCGTSGDRAQAGAVVQRFLVAVRHHDGGAACAQLSSDAVKALVQQEGGSCAHAVDKLQVARGAVTRVHVYLTSAKADVQGGESAFLDRGPQGWELSAVGCKPQGKPTNRPFDCELEG